MADTGEKDTRLLRKDEHIGLFLQNNSEGCYNGFEDVVFQNNSLPELAFDDIDTSCSFLGKKISFPVMINAMTGGTERTGEINRQLAVLAVKYNLPIAVGSQAIALDDPAAEHTFRIVRETNRGGIVIANISANSPYQRVQRAAELVAADAVQLHLNAAQELCMPEGDRNFRGIFENIGDVLKHVDIPVIVKEVGFGISFETAKKLIAAGVEYIDVGGKGGTNFIKIEDKRAKKNNTASHDFSFLHDWGIPTALSLLECANAGGQLNIISSGGIRKAEEVVKSLCMGAKLAGISGILLRELLTNGFGEAGDMLERLMYETRVIMLLLGAANIGQLQQVPYLLKGTLKELYEAKFA